MIVDVRTSRQAAYRGTLNGFAGCCGFILSRRLLEFVCSVYLCSSLSLHGTRCLLYAIVRTLSYSGTRDLSSCYVSCALVFIKVMNAY